MARPKPVDAPGEINLQAANTLVRWRLDPEAFAKEALGFNPSNQQREGFAELRNLIRAKLKKKENERLRTANLPELPITPQEQTYIEKMGISIMSGKGTGKDAWCATVIIWFLVCFSRAKVPITGPSYDQLKDVLMPEVSKWLDQRAPDGSPRCLIPDLLEVKSETIQKKDPDRVVRAFAHIRTVAPGANEKQQEAVLGGWHEDFLMSVADEASGVPEGVLKSLENTLTRPVNFALLIFNPNRNEGFAYDTHFGKRQSKWVQLHWDSRQSSLVDKQQIQNMEDLYGKDGAEYRVYVLGLPPENEPDALINRTWVLAAQTRYADQPLADHLRLNPQAPIVMGIDPSRGGKDPAIILTRSGRRIIDIAEYREADSVRLADQILAKIGEHQPTACFIDVIGIGGPIYDIVRRHYPQIRPVDVARTSSNPRFPKVRDELWWKMRQRFEDGLIDIPQDPILRNELTSIKWSTTTKGQVKIEAKTDLKLRNMPSPNRADALMLTMQVNESVLLTMEQEMRKDGYDTERSQSIRSSRYSWMRR